MRQAGTADVLDRIFEGMQQRFLPDKANDVNADIAFEITDDGETHNYVVTVRDADCKAGVVPPTARRSPSPRGSFRS